MTRCQLILLITLMLFALCGSSNAQRQVESPPPSPFNISSNPGELVIEYDGGLFAKYSYENSNKPYLWSIIGPTGKSMTRAYPMEKLDSEAMKQRDHPHHRGLWFGHESSGLVGWTYPRNEDQWQQVMNEKRSLVGGDSWHEQATFDAYRKSPGQAKAGRRRPSTLARIQHREFKTRRTQSDHAVVVEICDHLDRDGKRFLTEQRTIVFRATGDTRSIDFDQKFSASDGDVIMEDRKDAGVGIRVPTSMAMDSKQGGLVVNSRGQPVKKAWGQPARWCDYHGPVEGEHLGIAFLSHPASHRFPTRWHVREYGLFAANPFGQKSFDSRLANKPTLIKQGESLLLKHRLIFHRGDADAANIETAWQEYAKESTENESG